MKAKKTDTSSNNSSRSYYSHHVYFVKKDGGEWELLKRNSEADALKEIVQLKLIVKLSNASKRIPVSLKLSSKYTVTKNYQKMELSWRNRIGFGPLFLGIFATVFIAFGYTIITSTPFAGLDLPIFPLLVVSFIGIVFVTVIVGNVMKMFKNAKAIYAVSITIL